MKNYAHEYLKKKQESLWDYVKDSLAFIGMMAVILWILALIVQ